MTLSTRRATIRDLDALVPLFDAYRQFYAQPTDQDLARRFLRERFEHGQSIVFIAEEIAEEDDGAALGFTQLYPSFSSTRAARIFVLNDLFVAPAGRKRGLGAALLAAAADYSRGEGAALLALRTARTNLAAQSLYEAQGWKRDDVFLSYDLSLT